MFVPAVKDAPVGLGDEMDSAHKQASIFLVSDSN